MRRPGSAWVGLVASALAVGSAGCRDATQISVVVEVDFPCEQHRTTTFHVGEPGALETREPSASADACVDGRVGSLTLTPSGDDDGPVAFRVVTAVGASGGPCEPPAYGDHCIVARRSLRYLEHTPLTLPVAVRLSCAGVPCGPDTTCVDGLCRSAAIEPADCTAPGGCDEGLLGGAGGAGGAPGSGGGGGAGDGGSGAGGAGGGPSAPAGSLVAFGGSGDDELVDVDRASDGALLLAGHTDGPLDFGAGPLSGPDRDMVVAAFDASGALAWAHRMSGTGEDRAQRVAFGALDSRLLWGTFNDEMLMPGGALQSTAKPSEAICIRLLATGSYVTAERFAGGDDVDRVEALDLVTSDDAIYVTGTFDGTTLSQSLQVTNRGGEDLFVARLHPGTAQREWVVGVGTALDDGRGALARRPGAGTIGMAVPYGDTLYVGSTTHMATAASAINVGLATFTTTGAPTDFVSLGGPGSETPHALAFDALDQPVLAGIFTGSVQFSGDPVNANGAGNAFVGQLDDTYFADPLVAWHAGAKAEPNDMALDAAGRIVVVGTFLPTLSVAGSIFGGGQGESTFVTVLDGTDIATVVLAGDGDVHGSAVAVDADTIHVVGWFTGTITLGGRTVTSQGGRDMFHARLARPLGS